MSKVPPPASGNGPPPSQGPQGPSVGHQSGRTFKCEESRGGILGSIGSIFSTMIGNLPAPGTTPARLSKKWTEVIEQANQQNFFPFVEAFVKNPTGAKKAAKTHLTNVMSTIFEAKKSQVPALKALKRAMESKLLELNKPVAASVSAKQLPDDFATAVQELVSIFKSKSQELSDEINALRLEYWEKHAATDIDESVQKAFQKKIDELEAVKVVLNEYWINANQIAALSDKQTEELFTAWVLSGLSVDENLVGVSSYNAKLFTRSFAYDSKMILSTFFKEGHIDTDFNTFFRGFGLSTETSLNKIFTAIWDSLD